MEHIILTVDPTFENVEVHQLESTGLPGPKLTYNDLTDGDKEDLRKPFYDVVNKATEDTRQYRDEAQGYANAAELAENTITVSLLPSAQRSADRASQEADRASQEADRASQEANRALVSSTEATNTLQATKQVADGVNIKANDVDSVYTQVRIKEAQASNSASQASNSAQQAADSASQASNSAQQAADSAQQALSGTQGHSQTASQAAAESQQYADASKGYRDEAEGFKNDTSALKQQATVDLQGISDTTKGYRDAAKASEEAAKASEEAVNQLLPTIPTLPYAIHNALVERSTKQRFEDMAVSVKDFGAVGDGVTDDTQAVLTALTVGNYVVVPEGTFVVGEIRLSRPVTLHNRGRLLLKPNIANGSSMFISDGVDGIHIFGGEFDGNAENQNPANTTHLFYLQNTSDSSIRDCLVHEHWCAETGTSTNSKRLHCVHMDGGERNRISGITLKNWSNEGIVMTKCQNSIITQCVTHSTFGEPGGTLNKNYSSVQCSGDTNAYNTVSEIRTYNNGASAVGMDSQYSTMSDIIVNKVRYQNGVNLGHTGSPASYSVVTNVTIENILDDKNQNSAGLQISNGTEHLRASNITIHKSVQKGINCSNLGKNISLSNILLSDCVTAISVYAVDFCKIDDMRTVNCTNGLSKQKADDVLFLSDIDLTGATNKIIGSEANITGRNVVFDNTQPTSGNTVISDVALPLRVNNPNFRGWSLVSLSAAQANGAKSLPFLKAKGPSYIDIDTVNTPEHYSSVRWSIV